MDFFTQVSNLILQSTEIKNLQFPKVNIIVHILHIHFDWCIIGNAKQRRSILVGAAVS